MACILITNHVKVFKGKNLGSWNYYFHVEKNDNVVFSAVLNILLFASRFFWFTWKNVLQRGGKRGNGKRRT